MLKINKTIQNRFAFYSVLLLCVYILIFTYYTFLDVSNEGKNPSPYGIDFADYYAAGQMVISGEIDNIYNVPVHHEYLEKVLNRKVPFLLAWVYPPTFLQAIVPLSYLSYYPALVIWLFGTFVSAFCAVYLLVPKHKSLAFLILGFPGVLMNMRWGQNGFLNTALIGFGIYFFEANPVLSGLMFGLLTYKPQMALFPLLLFLILKRWRVLFWSIFFAIISATASGLFFGFDTWVNFAGSFFNSANALMDTEWGSLAGIQPSISTALQLAGIHKYTSYILLGLISAAVTFFVWWVWKTADRIYLKGSALVIGILLTIPYFIQYDLVILGIPLILLSYDCLEYGYRRYEIILLYILWLMPLINWPLVQMTRVQICPIVLLAILLMTIIRTKISAIYHGK